MRWVLCCAPNRQAPCVREPSDMGSYWWRAAVTRSVVGVQMAPRTNPLMPSDKRTSSLSIQPTCVVLYIQIVVHSYSVVVYELHWQWRRLAVARSRHRRWSSAARRYPMVSTIWERVVNEGGGGRLTRLQGQPLNHTSPINTRTKLVPVVYLVLYDETAQAFCFRKSSPGVLYSCAPCESQPETCGAPVLCSSLIEHLSFRHFSFSGWKFCTMRSVCVNGKCWLSSRGTYIILYIVRDMSKVMDPRKFWNTVRHAQLILMVMRRNDFLAMSWMCMPT